MTSGIREFPEDEPRGTGWEEDAGTPAPAPSPAAASPLPDVDADSAAAADRTAAGPVADNRWSKVQATFVDDPRGSVAEAASMADQAVDTFIATVRERQASLASLWQTEQAGTEQLRAALQEYRAFWADVTELSRSA
jgi:hypothetical protein